MDNSDVLSEVFSSLRLRSGIYFQAEFAGAFSIEVPAEKRQVRFHLVRKGSGWVSVPALDDAVQVSEGDLVLVPNGASQVLSDMPERSSVPLGDVVGTGAIDGSGVLRYGGGGGHLRLLCGFCRFDEDVEHPVVANLPDIIVLRARDLGSEPWITTALRLLELESDLNEHGMNGVLSRLLEIVFVQTVRRLGPEQSDARPSYMSALADAHLSKALLAIHREPETAWRVTDLARVAGMSRARFADRFSAIVGMTPIGYLTEWRLTKARALLRDTDLAVEDIALRCGYASVPSFSRRFKAAFSIGPGAFRRASKSS